MAINHLTPAPRSTSPAHDAPGRALGPPALERSASMASTTTSDISDMREFNLSRQSSVTFASSTSSRASEPSSDVRFTICGERPKKARGYVRPQGTDFAASARHRESVLCLGSIAHLQYYFARTGLLDGKGANLKRKKKQVRPATLDLSMLRAESVSPRLSLMSPRQPADSPPQSLDGSPDLVPAGVLAGSIPRSTPAIDAADEDDQDVDPQFFLNEFDEPDPDMPPPTTSTYVHREKPVPPPPSMKQLKADLVKALDDASRALNEVEAIDAPSVPASPQKSGAGAGPTDSPQDSRLLEIQGVHVLDVVTLAIRAAKIYHTSHPHPERLDVIKPEKELRAELLSVMDALRKAATRSFANGFKTQEHRAMLDWVASTRQLLAKEEEVEEAERQKRKAWTWLHGEWTGRETEREVEFLRCLMAAPHQLLVDQSTSVHQKACSGRPLSVEKDAKVASKTHDGQKKDSNRSICDKAPLPAYEPAASVADGKLPTPFLEYFRDGLMLVRLHNAAVRASRRRFGAIGTYHEDTAVTYRAAENIRFWAKAAELRWETTLKVDALAIVQGNGGTATWLDFEAAILEWARRVRTEIASEMDD